MLEKKTGGWLGLFTLLEKIMLLVFFLVTNHLLTHFKTEDKSQFNLSTEIVGETTSSSNKKSSAKRKIFEVLRIQSFSNQS